MSCYHGEVINLSLRDVTILNKFKIIDIKKRFLGVVKIYTVELPSEKIEKIAKHFQSNMSTKLKKEWYITVHNRAEDRENWNEMINYAKKIGIPNSQCDFLPEDFSKRTY